MMNFKEMWKENNRIRSDARKFYKNYWKEIGVVNIGAHVVIYGGIFAIYKINEVRSSRRFGYDIKGDINKKKKS